MMGIGADSLRFESRVQTVDYVTERVGARFIADDMVPDDVVVERLERSIKRIVSQRPDAVLMAGSMETEAEDHIRRRWLPSFFGIGALATSFLFPWDNVETEWTAKARAFVNVRPEHRAQLERTTVAPHVMSLRMAYMADAR
jgi:hypothetical protein